MFLRLWKMWKFSLKKWWAKVRLKECIKSEQSLYQKDVENLVLEKPRLLDMEKSVDTLMFYGQDQLGNSLLVQISRRRRRESEVWLILRLKDGRIFTLPDHPATQIFNVRADAFHAAGLSLTSLVTLKTSRIKFNGLLRPDIRKEGNSSFNEEDLLPVRFNFIFSAKSKPLYWPYDWNLDLMATALAIEKWEGLSFLGMLTEPDSRGYDQYGAMKGEVFIGKKNDSAPERIELNLPGIKVRRWGPLPASHMNDMALIIGVCGDGMVFNIGVLASQEGLKHAQFGSIIHPNGLWDSINWTDLQLAEFNSENALGNSSVLKFRVQQKMYKAEIRTQRRSKVRLFRGRPIDWLTDCLAISLVVNGEIGYGIRIWSRLDTLSNAELRTLEPIYKTLTYYSIPPEPDKFIYLFFEDAAKSIPISGLKGASLAMLSVLALSSSVVENLDPMEEPAQRAVPPPEFTVPEGFIISSMALQKIIRTNVTIEKGIERLMVLAGEQMDVQYLCAEVANMIRYVDMDTEISNAINIAYKSLRESVTGKRKDFVLAVRSSITVEDSREVTASGQYENFLGVNNVRELLTAIKSCWASLYSCKNVQHRRDTIQPINLDMAVVIQTMVNADSGGLLMTQNPMSVDPYQTFISSNFGLGGSISAGEGQPDTFLVKRSYDFRQLTVTGKTVGTKKIVMQVNKKGVVQKKTSFAKVASLTNEIALKLTRIGIELERLYGHVMNIEWAVVGTEIFILQCRRINTGIELTDWELKHEFDSPVMSTEDLYTTANIALKKHVDEDKNSNINRLIPCFNYHMFLDVFNFIATNNKPELTVTDIVMGYTIMGKDYMTQDIHRIALKRYPVNSKRGFMHIIRMLTARDYAEISNTISNAFKNYYSKSNLMEFENALDLLDDMERNYWRVFECSRCHYKASSLSTFYDAVAVILVCDHHPVMAPEVQEDLRIIMGGVNGSVSNEIPKKVEELMRLILMSGKKAEFCNLDRLVAEEWLEINIPEAAKVFEVFIQKYRHRGMEEMEVFSISWGQDPKLVMEMLQRALWNVKTADDLNDHKLVVHRSPGQLVSQLRAAKGWIRKRVLRTVIGRVQKAALAREATKNSLVSCLYEFRVAFRCLGGLMVREGLLSSPDLLYFMTPTEWRTLVKERSFTLVRRALQRKRVFLELSEEDFLEFNSGVPVPMKRTSKSDAVFKNAVKGTSICGGVVKGPAAVLKNSKELWKIKAGDIVVTHVLDIGLSPYFPVIKGIVTELGGLLSHGTVVQDYGLPCIMGATDATVFFEHGEMVTLDADNGVLFRELK